MGQFPGLSKSTERVGKLKKFIKYMDKFSRKGFEEYSTALVQRELNQ